MSNDVNVNVGTTGKQWDPDQFGNTGVDNKDTVIVTSEDGTFQTTITVSGDADVDVGVYTNNPSQPGLEPTTSNDPSAGFVALQTLFDYPTLFNQFMSLYGDAPEGSTAKTALEDQTVTPDEDLNFVVTDDAIISRASALGVSPQQLYVALSAQASVLLNEKLSGLSEEEAEKLRFAFLTPDGQQDLSVSLKALYSEIKVAVESEIAEMYGLPEAWQGLSELATPADVKAYMESVSNEFDEAFQKALQAFAKENGLSEDVVSKLLTMHYMEGASSPDPVLKNYLATLNEQARAELQDKYGFGANFPIEPNTGYYTSVINGTYITAFNKALKEKNLSAEDRALVEKYFANPDDPSVPDSIKDLVKSIKEAVLPGIIAQFSLSADFNPTVKSLTLSPEIQAAVDKIFAAFAQAKEVIGGAAKLVNDMPDGPEKTLYLDFLKAIGAALHELEQSIYAIQSAQTSITKALSRAKLDMELNKLKVTQQAQEQVSEKQGKMAKTGPISDILTWVGNIFMIAFSLLGGPIAFATALTFVIDSTMAKANKTTPLLQKMFQDISQKMGSTAAGAAVSFIVLGLMSCGNPFVMLPLMTESARTIQDFVKICGGDTNAQNITAAVFNAVMQLVCMVVLTVLTGGAASPALVSGAIANILGISKTAAETAIKVASIALNIIITSLTVVESTIQLNNNILLAQIDIIKGTSKAFAAKVEGLISELKKIIQKLLELLQGNTEWIVDISRQQGAKYSDASHAATQLNIAAQA